MEPKQNGPSTSREGTAVHSGEYAANIGVEHIPGVTPERAPERLPELHSVQAEVVQVAMPALPTPVLTQDDAATPAVQTSTPSSAGDDDLIEKEWVDKAKKVIAETKDDPYRREKEISKLQIEYIRKRYGREIGDAGD